MKISTHITILTLLIISISGCDRIFNGSLNQSPKELATNMVAEPVSNINPSKLCPIFTYDSNYTDLQRETIENDIKGKTIQWKLQVYEVRSTSHQDVFRIQTRECIPESSTPAFNQLEKDILSALKNLGGDLGASIASSLEVNRNVSTNIDLVVLNENDRNRLHQLKTDDWIVVRGRISGVFLRSIQLEPAVFSDSIQFINQSIELKHSPTTSNNQTINAENHNPLSKNNSNSQPNYISRDNISRNEMEKLIFNTATLAALPIDSNYTNNDWAIIGKNFPNMTWTNYEDKIYTDSKYLELNEYVTIEAKGARTMIFESNLTIWSNPDYFNLFDLLRKFNITEERCDENESKSFYERLGKISINGNKPIKFSYEFSTGNGGFASQSLTFNNKIDLPSIGSKGDNSVWSSNCN